MYVYKIKDKLPISLRVFFGYFFACVYICGYIVASQNEKLNRKKYIFYYERNILEIQYNIF